MVTIDAKDLTVGQSFKWSANGPVNILTGKSFVRGSKVRLSYTIYGTAFRDDVPEEQKVFL